MKKASIFTLQHDEDFFLPIWIKYYRQHFNPEDMYILAHNPTELSEKILKESESIGINVERLYTYEIFDHDWLNDTVHSTRIKLLKDYEYVIYTDCDEIIFPVGKSLKEFMDEAHEDAYRCFGFNVIENNIARENRMDKTLISKIPLIYGYGYHDSIPSFPISENLNLYHLHKLNYEKAWQRSLRLAAEKWNHLSLSTDMAQQNRIIDENKFKTFFYEENNELMPIPDDFKKILELIYNDNPINSTSS